MNKSGEFLQCARGSVEAVLVPPRCASLTLENDVSQILPAAAPGNREAGLRRLRESGVRVVEGAKVAEVMEGGVVVLQGEDVRWSVSGRPECLCFVFGVFDLGRFDCGCRAQRMPKSAEGSACSCFPKPLHAGRRWLRFSFASRDTPWLS